MGSPAASVLSVPDSASGPFRGPASDADGGTVSFSTGPTTFDGKVAALRARLEERVRGEVRGGDAGSSRARDDWMGIDDGVPPVVVQQGQPTNKQAEQVDGQTEEIERRVSGDPRLRAFDERRSEIPRYRDNDGRSLDPDWSLRVGRVNAGLQREADATEARMDSDIEVTSAKEAAANAEMLSRRANDAISLRQQLSTERQALVEQWHGENSVDRNRSRLRRVLPTRDQRNARANMRGISTLIAEKDRQIDELPQITLDERARLVSQEQMARQEYERLQGPYVDAITSVRNRIDGNNDRLPTPAADRGEDAKRRWERETPRLEEPSALLQADELISDLYEHNPILNAVPVTRKLDPEVYLVIARAEPYVLRDNQVRSPEDVFIDLALIREAVSSLYSWTDVDADREIRSAVQRVEYRSLSDGRNDPEGLREAGLRQRLKRLSFSLVDESSQQHDERILREIDDMAGIISWRFTTSTALLCTAYLMRTPECHQFLNTELGSAIVGRFAHHLGESMVRHVNEGDEQYEQYLALAVTKAQNLLQLIDIEVEIDRLDNAALL